MTIRQQNKRCTHIHNEHFAIYYSFEIVNMDLEDNNLDRLSNPGSIINRRKAQMCIYV